MTDYLVKHLRSGDVSIKMPDGSVQYVNHVAADRIEQLEAALRPFARVIEEMVTGDFSDDHPAWFDCYSPVVSDFKRAYELVGKKKDGN